MHSLESGPKTATTSHWLMLARPEWFTPKRPPRTATTAELARFLPPSYTPRAELELSTGTGNVA